MKEMSWSESWNKLANRLECAGATVQEWRVTDE